MFQIRKLTTRGVLLSRTLEKEANVLIHHADAALVSLQWEPAEAFIQWDDDFDCFMLVCTEKLRGESLSASMAIHEDTPRELIRKNFAAMLHRVNDKMNEETR